jgi:hypothetical protein
VADRRTFHHEVELCGWPIPDPLPGRLRIFPGASEDRPPDIIELPAGEALDAERRGEVPNA